MGNKEEKIYELVDVPGGDDIKIIAISRSTNQYHESTSGTKSPWWMIGMKGASDLLSSTIEGKDGDIDYGKCAELYGFHIESGRYTNSDISDQLFTSAMIRHDDCIVLIPNGGYVAEIENAQLMGKPFLIKLACLGWFENKLVVYQKIIFKNAFITSVMQDLDRAFVRFRVQEKTFTFTPYSQAGTKRGAKVCSVDFSKNTAAPK